MGRSTLSCYGEVAQTSAVWDQPNCNFRTSRKRVVEATSDSGSEQSDSVRVVKKPKRMKPSLDKVSPNATPKSSALDVAVWAKAYRKAFPNFLFYFDQIDENVKQQLAPQIRRLGGRMEPFFSSKITHLITCQSKSNESRYMSPSKSSRAFPMSPTASKTSVASELAQKASKWGIKVWTTQKLFNVLRHLLKSPMSSLSQPSKPLTDVLRDEKMFGISTHSSLSTNSSNVHFLKQIYLLVEDTTKAHRPIAVREYFGGGGGITWPKIYRNTEGKCPFIKYEEEPKSSKTPQISSRHLNSNTAATPQPATPISIATKPSPVIVIPKKPGYCENCQAKFADLEEHVHSPIHCKYALDNSSYVELDAILESVTRKAAPSLPVESPESDSESTVSSIVSGPAQEYTDVYQTTNDEGDLSDEGYASLKTISDSEPTGDQSATQYDIKEPTPILGDHSGPTEDDPRISCDHQQHPLEGTLAAEVENFDLDPYFTMEQPQLYNPPQRHDFQSTQFAPEYMAQPFHDQHYAQTDYTLHQVPTQEEIYAAIRDFQQYVQGDECAVPALEETLYPPSVEPTYDALSAREALYCPQVNYQPMSGYHEQPLSYGTGNDFLPNGGFLKPNQRMSIQELLLTDVGYFLNNGYPTTPQVDTWYPDNNNNNNHHNHQASYLHSYVNSQFSVP
ncbi:hypothetical protein K493DRAFT_308577 [Basidiobolus meristosporus CBS 931.73]|uniref:DBF4-type domain-containing protein n=1 Tax=Basidiobolus meristosporus CBS 931.73 TaxID=1314790 RepID=A0A1Y1X010_9FUNG|nr:hypothetical protein K493DRAFT_308577 [Basidiobolus meristosporus CBS 931.73]|eukprot:ORX79167.1 hypothetical protein K493DRAFT_308577 [Basidiobolus meristosporus CBS 931.73]